jgi:hypothetical protein
LELLNILFLVPLTKAKPITTSLQGWQLRNHCRMNEPILDLSSLQEDDIEQVKDKEVKMADSNPKRTATKRMTTFDLLVNWFAGKDEINGGSKGYGDMLNWLKKNRDQKIYVCTVFYEKPIEFLARGQTRSGKGDGRPVDANLLQFLPQHNDHELTANRSAEKYGVFINVNFTMVKRVALYGAEHTTNPKSLEWVKRYGGKPSTIVHDSIKGNDETKRIKWETIIRFRAEMGNYRPTKN